MPLLAQFADQFYDRLVMNPPSCPVIESVAIRQVCEHAAATGQTVRVPVQVGVTVEQIGDSDVGTTLRLAPQLDTVELKPIQISLTDELTLGLLCTPDARDHATQLAANYARRENDQLVAGGPVRVEHSDIMATTLYTYYVTNGTHLTSNNAITVLMNNWVGVDYGTAQVAYNNTPNITNYASGSTWYQDVYGELATETPEQRASREAAERVWQEEHRRREAKMVVVRARADKLWLAHLTPEQRRTWLELNFVEVKAPSGTRYRIKNYRSGNVFLLDTQGREVRKYCAYANDPGGSLPNGDYWFTQMLALQFDERMFLRAANTWDMLRPGAPFVGQGVDADRELVEIAA